MSSIDYKIKLSQWTDSAMKWIQGMTENDATIYFLTYRALLEDIDNVNQTTNKEVRLQDYQADVRCFSIFIALQLFTSTKFANESKQQMLARDSWGIKEAPISSGASPRSKCTKINYTQSDYQIIIHFIKSNIKLFLRLISTDQLNSEASLSASEFNTLRVLFKINFPSGVKPTLSQQGSLSSIAPFYNQGGGHSVKVHMNIIADWLLQMITPESTDEVILMNGLNKCVTIRDNQIQNKDVRIVSCEDSYIYVDTNVKYMQISNCVNCTIMVAAVTKTCQIDKCESVNVTVASNYLKIGNCIDCTIHSYTQLEAPIIYGDTRNLTLAPHNAGYFELISHLRAADLQFIQPGNQVSQQIQNQVQSSIHNFSRPLQFQIKDQCSQLMQPIDFMKMSLPKKFNDHPLILCPPEYNEILQFRMEQFAEIQSKIKGAKLTSDQEKMLHVAIQGYFREWFVQSNHYKPITELVRMIEQEF